MAVILLHCLLETELMWTHTPVALWDPSEWMCSEWLSNNNLLGIANIAQHNMHGTKSTVKSLRKTELMWTHILLWDQNVCL